MGVKIRDKDDDGVFWVFVNHKGKRWSKKIGKRLDVTEKVAGKIEARLKLGLPIEDETEAKEECPTLRQFFETEFQSHLQSVREKTAESYRACFRRYIDSELGNKRLDEISRSDVKRFLAGLKNVKTRKRKDGVRKLAKDTVRIVHATLRVILGEAKDSDIIKVNPAERHGKMFRDCKRLHKINPFTTNQEAEAFLTASLELSPWYFPFAATLLHAGLRVSEGTNLHVVDLDFNRGLIHVREGKNESSIRPVECSDFLLQVLREFRKEREQRFGKDLPEFFFCTEAGQKIDPSNFRSRTFVPLLKKAGLGHRRIHDLRHSFATLHLQAGSPLQWVSKQMGHSSIKTTADVYYTYLPDTKNASKSNVLPTINRTASDNVLLLKKAR